MSSIDAGEVVYRITGDSSDVTRSLSETEQAAKQAGQGFGGLEDALGTIIKLLNDISANTEGLTSLRDGADDAADSANKAASATSGWADVLKGNLLADAVKTGLKELIDLLADFAKNAVEVGKSFDSAMSQVAATMGEVRGSEAFETLTAAAEEMGATTKYTAAEAAQALNYLALAGYNAEEAVSALPVTLNLAQAGGMELARASDMITDGMSALGLASKDAEENLRNMTMFTDQMAVTAQKSNTSVSQLGDALLAVGGTAKNLAGGITEANTVLGLLADNGIKAAEGGTSLRNIINSLIEKSDALAEMGVEISDESGNLRSLQDIFADLNTALEKYSGNAEKAAALGDIFKVYDLKSVNALLGTSTERWDELTAAIENSEGAASQMADTMNDNLEGALASVSSAAEAFSKGLYDKVSEPLKNVVSAAADAIRAISGENIDKAALSASLDSLAGNVSVGLESITGIFKNASENLIPALLGGINEHIEDISKNAGDLILAFEEGLISALPYIADCALKLVTGLANSIGDNLPRLIPAAVESVLEISHVILDNLDSIIDAAGKIIVALAEGLLDSLPLILQEAPGIIVSLADALIDSIYEISEFTAELCIAIADKIVNFDWTQMGKDTNNAIKKALIAAFNDGDGDHMEKAAEEKAKQAENYMNTTPERLSSTIENLKRKVGEYNGYLVDIANEGYITADIYNSLPLEIKRGAEATNTAIDVYLNQMISGAEEQIQILTEAYDQMEAVSKEHADEMESIVADANEYSPSADYLAFLQSQSEGTGKKLADTVKKITDDEAKALKNAAQIDLANGVINDEQYYGRIEEIAKQLGEESKLYDSYVLEVAKGRKKLREAREKEDENDRKQAETERRNSFRKSMEAIERTGKEQDLSNGELADMYKALAEAQEEGSDEYFSAYDKYLDKKKASDSDLKKQEEKALKERMAQIERTAKAQGKSDEWIIEEYKNLAEAQEEGSELYFEVYDKYLDKKARYDEKALKEQEQAAKKLEQERKKLYDKMSLSGDVFSEKEETDKWTGAKRKNRKVDTEGLEKKVNARGKLIDKIAKLLDAGVPDDIIDELLNADPEAALDYANQLLNNPKKLKKVKNLYEKDEGYRKTLSDMLAKNSEDYKAIGEETGAAFGDGFIDVVQGKWNDMFNNMYSDAGSFMQTAFGVMSANAHLPESSITPTSNTDKIADNIAAADGGSTAAKKRVSAPASGRIKCELTDINGTWLMNLVMNEAQMRKTVSGG